MYHIGATEDQIRQADDLAVFQKYELLVAVWLNGKVAPAGNPAFDVWNCEPFPRITINVKTSKACVWNKAGSGGYIRDSIRWSFMHNNSAHLADYFVLFGLRDNGSESCFVMHRSTFEARAVKSKYKNGIRYKVVSSTEPIASIGRNNHRAAWIFDYEVKRPASNLSSRILEIESCKQMRLI